MSIKSAERLFFVFVALILFQDGEIFAQSITKIPPVLSLERQFISFKYLRGRTERQGLMAPVPASGGKIDLYQRKKIAPPLAPGYFHSQLAFFCRTEDRVEKATSIPFRFRLGSLAYTDYLEGKPNAAGPR